MAIDLNAYFHKQCAISAANIWIILNFYLTKKKKKKEFSETDNTMFLLPCEILGFAWRLSRLFLSALPVRTECVYCDSCML